MPTLFQYLICIVVTNILLHSSGVLTQRIASNATALIPRKDFFASFENFNYKLSKDANFVSWIKAATKPFNIWVQSSALGQQAYQLTFDAGKGIRVYDWLHDNVTLLYQQDKDGDENYYFTAIDVKTKKIRFQTETGKGIQAKIIAMSPMAPQKIIIGLNNRNPRYHDLYELNTTSGVKKLIFKNFGYTEFVFDRLLNPRLLMQDFTDASKAYYLYDPKLANIEATVYPLYKKVHQDDITVTKPLSFDKSNKKIYWLDNDEGREEFGSLYLIDVETKSKTLLHKQTAQESIDSVILHPTEFTPLYLLLQFEMSRVIVLDKSFGEKYNTAKAVMARSFPQMNIQKLEHITIFDMASNFWIIRTVIDIHPSAYYLYDTVQKSAKFLSSISSVLSKYKFAPMNSVKITLSDSTTEQCYYTLPIDSDPSKSVPIVKAGPMIMNVHGGPWLRENWGFDLPAQFLASRGYTFMSCNFRSSDGFGKKWLNAGNGEWGRKMQSDLKEAVSWAISAGIAQKDKVAIYGGSYGGYAALTALTLSPDFYACGIDQFGVSNLKTLLSTIPEYSKHWYGRYVRGIGGDPKTAAGVKFLASISPLNYASKVKKPLLIVHGQNDPRVKVAESLQFVEALKKAHIPHTFMLFPKEGHGFTTLEGGLAFYAELEQFLSRCLGGRAEPLHDEFQGVAVNIERYP